MLVDSHCHLEFPEYADDFDGVLARAAENDVGLMLTISTRLSNFDMVRRIAEDNDNIYCSVGVHPHQSEEEEGVTVERLIELTDHPRVVGIGETGLDYHYDNSPRDIQRDSFRTHIAAARETGLPLIVHTRNADADTVGILQEEMGKGSFTGLIHCFSTTRYLAEAAIEMGLYVSCAGIITFKKADDLRETVRDLPLTRLLVETDAPYLAPMPHRGKRNEPAFVAHTAEKLAEIKGVSVNDVAAATTTNFFNLFTKIPRLQWA